jgi:hypothetical protein
MAYVEEVYYDVPQYPPIVVEEYYQPPVVVEVYDPYAPVIVEPVYDPVYQPNYYPATSNMGYGSAGVHIIHVCLVIFI